MIENENWGLGIGDWGLGIYWGLGLKFCKNFLKIIMIIYYINYVKQIKLFNFHMII